MFALYFSPCVNGRPLTDRQRGLKIQYNSNSTFDAIGSKFYNLYNYVVGLQDYLSVYINMNANSKHVRGITLLAEKTFDQYKST